MAVVAMLAATSLLAAVPVAPAAGRTLGPPGISAVPSTVQPGASVAVDGYDLTPLSDYQLVVCGNGGFGGSAECNLSSTSTAATSEIGHFVVDLTVQRPPVPCPCVVKAMPLSSASGTIQGTAVEVSTPITIVGLPTANPRPVGIGATPSGLVVDRADLVGARTWAEWFGGAPHRTLVLTLRDAGPNLIPSTPFVLRAGPAGNPTQIVQSPAIPTLHPGQVVRYRVPVTFPVLAHGDYVVVGTLGNAGQTVQFRATTFLMPWGIVFLLGLVVLIILALIVWRIVRRRRGPIREGTAAEAPAGGPAVGATEAGPDGVTPDPIGAATSTRDSTGGQSGAPRDAPNVVPSGEPTGTALLSALPGSGHETPGAS